jgi:hypothetical protein
MAGLFTVGIGHGHISSEAGNTLKDPKIKIISINT